jgi:hypothetical protein
VNVDTVAPTTTATLSQPANGSGWHNGAVIIALSASDNTGGSGVQAITFSASGAQSIASQTVSGTAASVEISAEGTTTITYSARDNAGNIEALSAFTVQLDSTPPVVSVTGIQAGAVYAPGAVPAAECQATDAGSGIAVPATLSLSGGNMYSVGEFTATCSGAQDFAGNAGTASVTYLVSYPFGGFLSPVDGLPTLNLVSAGRGVPVKFSLGGGHGLDLFAAGYPKSQGIPCDSTAPVDGVEETVSAGDSSLSYDAASDQYTYVWKTDKAWAGTCRQLVIQLNDGTYHRANFRFSK